MTSRASLYLASASAWRRAALERMGLPLAAARGMDIDETPKPDETASLLTERLARAKAQACAAACAAEGVRAWSLGYDTVAGVGRRILGKPQDAAAARGMLALLSGRSARLVSAVAACSPEGAAWSRVATARVRFKRLEPQEIESIIDAGAWLGRAGGLDLDGRAAAWVRGVNGAWWAAEGLPARETMAVLAASGFSAHTSVPHTSVPSVPSAH